MSSPLLPESFDDLPVDPRERHEACVALFGSDVFDVRNGVLRACNVLCESEEARSKYARLHRQAYDDIAKLPPEARQAAGRLAKRVLDNFIHQLIWMLGHGGFDHPLGPGHAIQYRLDMEVFDINSEEMVLCETVNRDGIRYFGSYWGRWLNAFGNLGDAKKD